MFLIIEIEENEVSIYLLSGERKVERNFFEKTCEMLNKVKI